MVLYCCITSPVWPAAGPSPSRDIWECLLLLRIFCVVCSLLRWSLLERRTCFSTTLVVERLLYVYLNYKALNNLPISRVKKKIYGVSSWQAAADLDSCGKTIVLTAPFSEQIQEQLLQVYVTMW